MADLIATTSESTPTPAVPTAPLPLAAAVPLVCFIHSCTLPMWGSEKLTDLVSQLRNSGLLAHLSHVFINNVGLPLDPHMFPEQNILITNYSEDTGQFENCTLRQMYFYAQLHQVAKILYMHTKGVSYPKEHSFSPNVQDWTNFMTYGLVDHYEFCIEMLDHVDTVGVNYRPTIVTPPQYPDPDHFSGNYWWVNAKYWITVPIFKLKTKADAEWILFKNNPTFINIIKSPKKHYDEPYKLSDYQEVVQQRIAAYRALIANIASERVYYGVPGCYIDITEFCKGSNSLCISGGDHERNVIYHKDPCHGVIKHVMIAGMTFNCDEELRLTW